MSMHIEKVTAQKAGDDLNLNVTGNFTSSGHSLSHKIVRDGEGTAVAVELRDSFDAFGPDGGMRITMPCIQDIKEKINIPAPVASNVEVRVIENRTRPEAGETFNIHVE